MIISYETHINSLESPSIDAYLELAEYDPALPTKQAGRLDDPRAHLLRQIKRREDLPLELRKWRDEAVGWIPPDAMKWWLAKHRTKPGMAPMRPEWWQVRATGMSIARNDKRKPIGALALTHITAGDREFHNMLPSELLAYELRGLVVEDGYEDKRAKIGTELARRIVALAYDLPPASITAITSNPMAARIFTNLGAKKIEEASRPEFLLDRSALQYILCWTRPWPASEARCSECPANPDGESTAYVWPRIKPEAVDIPPLKLREVADIEYPD